MVHVGINLCNQKARHGPAIPEPDMRILSELELDIVMRWVAGSKCSDNLERPSASFLVTYRKATRGSDGPKADSNFSVGKPQAHELSDIMRHDVITLVCAIISESCLNAMKR